MLLYFLLPAWATHAILPPLLYTQCSFGLNALKQLIQPATQLQPYIYMTTVLWISAGDDRNIEVFVAGQEVKEQATAM